MCLVVPHLASGTLSIFIGPSINIGRSVLCLEKADERYRTIRIALPAFCVTCKGRPIYKETVDPLLDFYSSFRSSVN